MAISISVNTHYPLKAVSTLDEEVLKYDKGLSTTAFFQAYFDVKDGRRLGHWYFSPMPGCCGVVVSHALEMEQQYRGKGYSESFSLLRHEVARQLGYSAIIATSLTSNFPEILSSGKAGWKLGPVFRNKRTSNDVTFQIKIL